MNQTTPRDRSRPRPRARGAIPVLAALLLAAGAVPAAAQSADSLRARYLLVVPEPFSPRSAPSMGLNSPVAFGASWGDVYGGAAFALRARFIEEMDGAVAVGFGLGNPNRFVGLAVDVNSFSTLRSGWGTNMALDLKLHRMLPGLFAIAVGMEGAATRGELDSGQSVYGVISKWFVLKPSDPMSPLSLSLSAGAGNGRFRTWNDFLNDEESVGVFGSAAFRFSGPASIVVDWTGQDLIAGLSLAPLARVPVIVTLGAADLTGTAGDGIRFVASAGAAIDFR